MFCDDWQCVTPKEFNPFEGLEPRWKARGPVHPNPGAEEPEPPKPEKDGSVYELTLTSPDDDVYYLRETLSKIVASKMFDVIRWQACIELTKTGLPHIHAILYSHKKYLDGTKIKKMFRHRYELSRVRSEEKYLLYIKKEITNNIVIDYCAKKGIPQIWTSVIPEQQL